MIIGEYSPIITSPSANNCQLFLEVEAIETTILYIGSRVPENIMFNFHFVGDFIIEQY